MAKVDFKKNARKTTTNEPIGQLGALLGKDSKIELYSEDNFNGSARVLIVGYEKGSDTPDYRFIADENISKELREAPTEAKFNKVMSSLADALVTGDEVVATKRNGAKIFDEDGEPVMETLYYLSLGSNRKSMKKTATKLAGTSKEIKKEETVWSWSERAVY